MLGTKLTLAQRNLLVDQFADYAETCMYNPVVDINGDYFIFEGEVAVTDKPEFLFVKDIEPSEYVPPYQPPIEMR